MAARRRGATPWGTLGLEGEFWRRAARWGAWHMPQWFVRAAPPLIGLGICTFGGDERRRRVLRNLHAVRGDAGALRDAVDTARTFVTYASCLTEVLGAGSSRGRMPRVLVHGELHVLDAMRGSRGVVLATAHTAGWETVGPLLTRDLGLRVMIVESPEADAGARAVQDGARRAQGLLVAHVGEDPLSALPLVRHLREGGVVALQIDRTPRGQRTRDVTMFGAPGRVPEGPLRLAALTGAPIIPVFSARTGHRRYEVQVCAPLRVARNATPEELDRAAQALADAMETFVKPRPTQWFHFEPTRT